MSVPKLSELVLKGVCPGCGRQLKMPFPYNVDLARNDVVVICSGCKLHSRIDFMSGLGCLGKVQGIFCPPYRSEVPTLKELTSTRSRGKR